MELRIGISYISEELARGAIERECGNATFEELRERAQDAWEEKLSRIEIEAESEEQMRTFYSCLYRTFLFPHKAYEYDREGKILHYSPCDGKVRALYRQRILGYLSHGLSVVYADCTG